MKITGRRALLVPLLSIGVMVGGCDSITDFGFNGHVSGVVVDPAGNPVSGNVATTDLRVFVLGEGELEPLEIRVKPDGTYQNTHLFPQVYDLWIEGPVVTPLSRDNPETVDLTGAPVTHNLTVTPFLSIATPVVT